MRAPPTGKIFPSADAAESLESDGDHAHEGGFRATNFQGRLTSEGTAKPMLGERLGRLTDCV